MIIYLLFLICAAECFGMENTQEDMVEKCRSKKSIEPSNSNIKLYPWMTNREIAFKKMGKRRAKPTKFKTHKILLTRGVCFSNLNQAADHFKENKPGHSEIRNAFIELKKK